VLRVHTLCGAFTNNKTEGQGVRAGLASPALLNKQWRRCQPSQRS
jgi:hypothetical protein